VEEKKISRHRITIKTTHARPVELYSKTIFPKEREIPLGSYFIIFYFMRMKNLLIRLCWWDFHCSVPDNKNLRFKISNSSPNLSRLSNKNKEQ
jgi:hypothetical protein